MNLCTNCVFDAAVSYTPPADDLTREAFRSRPTGAAGAMAFGILGIEVTPISVSM